MQNITVDNLKSALYDRKELKRLKSNYKKVFFPKYKWKFYLNVASIIVGIFLPVTVWCISLSFIFRFEMASIVTFILVIADILLIIAIGNVYVPILVDFVLVKNDENIVLNQSMNKDFLEFYCDKENLSAQKIFEYKKIYEKLSKECETQNDNVLELVKVIVMLIVFFLFIEPIKNSATVLDAFIGVGAIFTGVSIVMEKIFLFAMLAMANKVKRSLFNFNEVIERYEYILAFGYEMYKIKYK